MAGMNRIDRYIMLNYAMGIVPVMLLLLSLFSFLALAEELEEVGQGSFTLVDAFTVVLYSAPKRIVDLLPVTALLGGLMGLGAMANHQELIAARVAGMSKKRLARPVIAVALIAAAGIFLAQSFLIPVVENEAAQLRARSLEETDVDKGNSLEFWTRSGDSIIRVNNVEFNRLLTDIEIYRTDSAGRLQQLMQAKRATIIGSNNWILEDVVLTRFNGLDTTEELKKRVEWPGLLTDEQTAILMLPVEALAPRDLYLFISHLQQNDLDTHFYRVILWQQLSLSVAVIGMALLSLPLLSGSIRAIPASQRIVVGAIIGIIFYLIEQVTGHLAGLFTLDPPTTIMTPSLFLLAVAIYAQYHEGGRRRSIFN
jgi:lipopolysaccharide export system permease protein